MAKKVAGRFVEGEELSAFGASVLGSDFEMYVIARDHSKRFSSSFRAFPTLSFSSVSIRHTCAPLRIIHNMHNKHFLAVPFVGYERRSKRALSCWYLDLAERQSMSESSPVWKHESVRNIPSYFRNLKNFHRRASLETCMNIALDKPIKLTSTNRCQ
jgi:hypothetical protein